MLLWTILFRNPNKQFIEDRQVLLSDLDQRTAVKTFTYRNKRNKMNAKQNTDNLLQKLFPEI